MAEMTWDEMQAWYVGLTEDDPGPARVRVVRLPTGWPTPASGRPSCYASGAPVSAEPNQVTYSLHAPLPSDEKATQALWAHLQEFSGLATAAGWSVEVVVTYSKEDAGPGGE